MIATMEETQRETADTDPRWVKAGPPYLLTRDELVEELEKRQINISARQLRSWASYGLLPKTTRRIPPGATDGVARALYQIGIIKIIQNILIALSVGQTLESMKSRAGAWIKESQDEDHSFIPVDEKDPVKALELERAAVAAVRAYADYYARSLGHSLTGATSEMVFSNGTHHKLFIWPKPPWEDGT